MTRLSSISISNVLSIIPSFSMTKPSVRSPVNVVGCGPRERQAPLPWGYPERRSGEGMRRSGGELHRP